MRSEKRRSKCLQLMKRVGHSTKCGSRGEGGERATVFTNWLPKQTTCHVRKMTGLER